MFGIKIRDSNPHYDRLRDVLAAIGEKVLTSSWICRDLDYSIRKDGELWEIREDRRRLSGAEMMRFTDSVHQFFDGRFEARTEGPSKKLWLVIVVFDSSWIEVWTLNKKLLEKLKARFKKVSDMEQSYERK
jgi:hypothetical protein